MAAQYKLDKKIKYALIDNKGNISRAAKQLGYDRSTIYSHIQASEELKQVIFDARESAIDAAEETIQTAAANGDISAAKYILGTIGRNRGYVEKQDVIISGLDTLNISCGLQPINKEDEGNPATDPHKTK